LAAPASASPRVRVAALIQADGKVVLVRHKAGDHRYHLLPGGGVDFGETLEDALVREVHEETGLLVEIGHPLFLSDTIDPSGRRHVVNITFSATRVGGEVTDSPADARIEAVDLVSPESLAQLDLRPPMAESLVRALRGEVVSAEYLGSLFAPAKRGPTV